MFYIPNNFDDSGKIFNGMVETRKFVETSILSAILGKFLWTALSSFPVGKRIIITMIVLSPVAIFGLIGINGDSLTQFLKAFFMYFKNRKKLRFRRVDIDESDR